MQSTLETPDDPDRTDQLATTSPISEQYARRVIAALINPTAGRFDYSTADTIAEKHIAELEVTDSPMGDGDYGIHAVVHGIEKITNAKTLGLFGFTLAEPYSIGAADDGGIHVSFSGFRAPENESLTVEMDNGLIKSEGGIKCSVDIVLKPDSEAGEEGQESDQIEGGDN